MISSLYLITGPSDNIQYVAQNGVTFECVEENTISRVISTDPHDFLLYQPGEKIKIP